MLNPTQPASRRAKSAARALIVGAALSIMLAGCGSLTKTLGAVDHPSGSGAIFTAQRSGGTSITLPRHRPIVLLFFSVGCGGCGPAATALTKAQATNPNGADYALVDVAPGESATDVRHFLTSNKATALPFAIDADAKLLEAYNISQLSTLVILASNGHIAYRGIEPSAATISSELAKLAAS